MQDDRLEPEPRKRIAFALARVMVEKAASFPSDAAAAWLYEHIREGSVEAWYAAFIPGDPFHKSPTKRRDEFLRPIRLTSPEKLQAVPTDDFLRGTEVAVEDVKSAIAQEFASPGDGPAVLTEIANRADASPEPAQASGADIETSCYEWLAAEMRKSPECSPMPKARWKQEAQRRFRGLTGRAFDDRIWPRAIKETGAKWNASGRKSSH